MKKKLLVTLVFFALVIMMLAFSANAEECTEHIPVWTVNVGANGFLGEITTQGTCNNCQKTETGTIPPVFIPVNSFTILPSVPPSTLPILSS